MCLRLICARVRLCENNSRRANKSIARLQRSTTPYPRLPTRTGSRMCLIEIQSWLDPWKTSAFICTFVYVYVTIAWGEHSRSIAYRHKIFKKWLESWRVGAFVFCACEYVNTFAYLCLPWHMHLEKSVRQYVASPMLLQVDARLCSLFCVCNFIALFCELWQAAYQ